MREAITAIILSGGQGSRFDGQDKGLVQWRGQPLIQYVIDNIQPQTDHIIISCNRNHTNYASLGFTTCHDQFEDFQGPLAGVSAALALVDTDLAFICPCDTPRLPSNLVAKLLQQLKQQQASACYVNDGINAQPLLALLKTEPCSASIRHYLDQNKRSVIGWLQQQQAVAVDCSDQQACFVNINSQDHLDRLNSEN